MTSAQAQIPHQAMAPLCSTQLIPLEASNHITNLAIILRDDDELLQPHQFARIMSAFRSAECLVSELFIESMALELVFLSLLSHFYLSTRITLRNFS